MQPETTHPPVRLGKFAASWIIVKESFAILRQDKEIVWFPILSSVMTLVATVGLGFLLFFVFLGGTFVGDDIITNKQENSPIFYGMLLISYVIVTFIANFFQAGLFTIVNGRFSGKDLSFSDGISGAFKKSGNIFLWSLLSVTVGFILQLIAENFKLVGKILAYLLGAAWNILTFFSLPALVTEDVGVIDAFKESASVIRKKWGETIIVNFGVGLAFFVIYLVLIGLFIGAMVVAPSVIVFIVGTVLLFIAIIVLAVLSSTLSSIFKLAIFVYAKTGEIPQGFSEGVITGAVNVVEK
jgi:hypothetical protein